MSDVSRTPPRQVMALPRRGPESKICGIDDEWVPKWNGSANGIQTRGWNAPEWNGEFNASRDGWHMNGLEHAGKRNACMPKNGAVPVEGASKTQQSWGVMASGALLAHRARAAKPPERIQNNKC